MVLLRLFVWIFERLVCVLAFASRDEAEWNARAFGSNRLVQPDGDTVPCLKWSLLQLAEKTYMRKYWLGMQLQEA